MQPCNLQSGALYYGTCGGVLVLGSVFVSEVLLFITGG